MTAKSRARKRAHALAREARKAVEAHVSAEAERLSRQVARRSRGVLAETAHEQEQPEPRKHPYLA